jgi:hypothetical protein
MATSEDHVTLEVGIVNMNRKGNEFNKKTNKQQNISRMDTLVVDLCQVRSGL